MDIATPPRPTSLDSDALRPTVERFVSRLQDHLDDHEDTHELVCDLLRALDGRMAQDGYSLTKRLECTAGIEGDSEIVEMMDDLLWQLRDALNQAVKDWVKTNNLEPPAGIGDRVSCQIGGIGHVEGEVTGIKEDTAHIIVYSQSAGHVKKGAGTNGWVIPYERAQRVP